jgi:ubiquinone/menaquinone biosynthesis C-methylase UbiE
VLSAVPTNVRTLPTRGRSEHVRAVYERAASGYDRFYRRAWIAAAGGRAEQAMLNQVAVTLASLDHPRVLDAGAGTGALSRRLARLLPKIHPVLVDLSPAMLARAADLADPRAVASVTALPFGDGTFDAVVCAWVIETVDDPHAAVTELLRVLRPGGRLVYSFCSRPTERRDRWRTGPLRAIVHGVFAGHFLDDAQTPFHRCDVSHRTSYAGGAVTVVSLGTCCTVNRAEHL